MVVEETALETVRLQLTRDGVLLSEGLEFTFYDPNTPPALHSVYPFTTCTTTPITVTILGFNFAPTGGQLMCR